MHFACHGTADLDVPLRGGLVLAGDELLTVGMLRASSLSQGMAVLSACETGVPGAALPDEAVGLPSALLQAGLTIVIASLWSVPDDATAILMIELYRRMVRDGDTPAASLRGAQQWVRDTTDAQKAATWKAATGDWLPEIVAQWLQRLVGPGETHSYADPAQWAAFIHVGA
jgi:CHAT domain-containing protein